MHSLGSRPWWSCHCVSCLFLLLQWSLLSNPYLISPSSAYIWLFFFINLHHLLTWANTVAYYGHWPLFLQMLWLLIVQTHLSSQLLVFSKYQLDNLCDGCANFQHLIITSRLRGSFGFIANNPFAYTKNNNFLYSLLLFAPDAFYLIILSYSCKQMLNPHAKFNL